MIKKIVKKELIILLLAVFMCSCSVKEFRSPIVFRSPVILDKPESPQPAEISVTSASTEEAVASEKPTGLTPPSDVIHSSAGIPVLSEQDLLDENFSTLGRIYVSSPTKEGFSREESLRELRLEAFKRYGSLAQGITNIEYRKGFSMLSKEEKSYQEVSGDVIMPAEEKVIQKQEAKKSISAISGVTKETRGAFPLEEIQVLSSDDLYELNFKVLGKVRVRDRSEEGLTEDQVIKALKIEAFRNYGSQAKGLTNISLLKKQMKFYYTKVRKNISTPKQAETYERASAEVIVWD